LKTFIARHCSKNAVVLRFYWGLFYENAGYCGKLLFSFCLSNHKSIKGLLYHESMSSYIISQFNNEKQCNVLNIVIFDL